MEYTRARNAAKTDTRRAVRNYEREIAKQAKKNPKAFYRYVNGKLKTRANIANLRTVDGREISEDKDRAEEFNRFFGSVYTKEDTRNIPDKMRDEGTNVLDSIDISEAEVLRMLTKLQPEN